MAADKLLYKLAGQTPSSNVQHVLSAGSKYAVICQLFHCDRSSKNFLLCCACSLFRVHCTVHCSVASLSSFSTRCVNDPELVRTVPLDSWVFRVRMTIFFRCKPYSGLGIRGCPAYIYAEEGHGVYRNAQVMRWPFASRVAVLPVLPGQSTCFQLRKCNKLVSGLCHWREFLRGKGSPCRCRLAVLRFSHPSPF